MTPGTVRQTTCSTCSKWVRRELCTRLLLWHPAHRKTLQQEGGCCMGGASGLLLSDTTMRLPPVSGLSEGSLGLRQVCYWIWVQDLSKTHHP